MKQAILIGIILGVVACSPAPPSPTASPAFTASPLEDRLELEMHYQTLRVWENALKLVWEALAQGKTANCGGNYETLSPSLFEASQALENQLRIATRALFEAEQLWQAECALPRRNVPPERIQNALDQLHAANLALKAAQDLLEAQ